MPHKIARIRIKRKRGEVTIDALGRSARGTPFIVKSVKGVVNMRNKHERKTQMTRLMDEVLSREPESS